MKKNIFFVIIFIILNGCAQYSSIIGPTYTMAKSGSFLNTAAYMATSHGFKKKIGQSPGEYVNSFINQKENARECQTLHTSALNEIFFETLDEFDCFRDPFSILK